MGESLETITLLRLSFAFIPVLVVIILLVRWAGSGKTALYALARMLVQLLLVGYVLTFVFGTDNALIITGILSLMLVAASWIALRPVRKSQHAVYGKALAAISLGGVTTLGIILCAVLNLPTWYRPDYAIPLAGMIFANSMNSVSLAAERFEAETGRGLDYQDARRTAFNAALLPLVNTLFAVGVVSLPGMMTGQILSGVAPHTAARYQIMVMCMVFGAAGISAAAYLWLIKGPDDLRDRSLIQNDPPSRRQEKA